MSNYECLIINFNLTEDDKNTELISDNLLTSPPIDVSIENSTLFTIPPNFFKKYNEIEYLTATKCSIQEIHYDTFADAFKLLVLEFSYNNIKIIPDFAFRNNSVLEELTLDHNQIQQLTTNAFRGLTKLSSLILSSNKITHLPLYIFEPLESLVKLKLDGNQITVISLGQFSTNFNLNHIDLRNNHIRLIDNGTFNGIIKSLKLLELENNICVNSNYTQDRSTESDLIKQLRCCYSSQEADCEQSHRDDGQQEEDGIGKGIWIFLIIFMITANVIFVLLMVFRRKIRNWRVGGNEFELRAIIDNSFSYQI